MTNQRITQTLQILEEYAKNKQLINYQELYEKIGLNREIAADRKEGARILAEVNRITIGRNDIMISSLVTLRGNQQPADGFFEFAIELGRLNTNASDDDKLKFWVDEVKKTFNAYDKKR